jgi:hypothetical protein
MKAYLQNDPLFGKHDFSAAREMASEIFTISVWLWFAGKIKLTWLLVSAIRSIPNSILEVCSPLKAIGNKVLILDTCNRVGLAQTASGAERTRKPREIDISKETSAEIKFLASRLPLSFYLRISVELILRSKWFCLKEILKYILRSMRLDLRHFIMKKNWWRYLHIMWKFHYFAAPVTSLLFITGTDTFNLENKNNSGSLSLSVYRDTVGD